MAPELLVVLGGPIGVYESDAYPFLEVEIDLLQRRIASGRPLLGICLGAQLIATTLGAKVYPGPAKEIGWEALELTIAGDAHPLRHIGFERVLHWHGDTFDLPADTTLLASTDICPNQAFARGPNVLALQFHPELLASEFEHWLIGHASELAQASLSVEALRAATARHGPELEQRSSAFIREWLDKLDPGGR